MVLGYPISTNLPRVDGLSMDPRDLGCHTVLGQTVTYESKGSIEIDRSPWLLRIKINLHMII